MTAQADPPRMDDIRQGVAFLKARLLRPITVEGRLHQALAETEAPVGESRWFWTDDNAKALELLAMPALWDAEPAMGEAILGFILAMSAGPGISRRAAEPQLVIRRDDPQDFLILTPFHEFSGNLAKGVLHQACRFNDGRSRIAASHTGNLVGFRHRGRKHSIDVEDGIIDCGIERSGADVLLFHDSLVQVPGSLLRTAPYPVARLRYEYRVSGDDPRLRLRVTLTAVQALSGIALSTAADGMQDRRRVVTLGLAGGAARVLRHHPEGVAKFHQGPLEHIALHEDGMPGHAHALHIRPAEAATVKSVVATYTQPDRPHWVVLRHDGGSLAENASVTIEEARLLTSGGGLTEAPAVAAAMAGTAMPQGIDPSTSYDRGAELNAVATHCFFAGAGGYATPIPPARQAMLRGWFDRQAAAYFRDLAPAGDPAARMVFVRGLAFAVLAFDTMLRATRDSRYETDRQAALELLIAAQSGSPDNAAFLDTGEATAFLDCHAAALLALARLVRPDGDARLGPALRRGLAALRFGAIRPPQGDTAMPFDTVVVRTEAAEGRITEDGAFWSYKAGLLLRALRAVEHAVLAGNLDLSAAERRRAADLAKTCEAQLAGCLRRHADGAEYLTSPYANETNSETQPWALLALASPDAAIAGWQATAAGGDTGLDARPPAPLPALEPLLVRNMKILAAELVRGRYAAGLAGPQAPAVPTPVLVPLASRLCCQADIESPWLRHWCGRMQLTPVYHRKLWETCYVPQAVWEAGLLRPGSTGLGFGVGQEPLPSLFASFGVQVLATDLDPADPRAQPWRAGSAAPGAKDDLHRPGIVDAARFERLVQAQPADMAAIPATLMTGRFDFLWSLSALHHLGTLEAGESFIRHAMRCLRPGGIAIHTTEFNLDDQGGTIAAGPVVLPQLRHLRRLATDLVAEGHRLAALGVASEPGALGSFVDLPPYPDAADPLGQVPDVPHLRLLNQGHAVTSVGLLIRKAAG